MAATAPSLLHLRRRCSGKTVLAPFHIPRSLLSFRVVPFERAPSSGNDLAAASFERLGGHANDSRSLEMPRQRPSGYPFADNKALRRAVLEKIAFELQALNVVTLELPRQLRTLIMQIESNQQSADE
jgi:hypothetical protein